MKDHSPPIVVGEVVVDQAPEDLGAGGQRQRVQDEGDGDLGAMLRYRHEVLYTKIL